MQTRVQVIFSAKHLRLAKSFNLDFLHTIPVHVYVATGKCCWKSPEARTGLSRQGLRSRDQQGQQGTVSGPVLLIAAQRNAQSPRLYFHGKWAIIVHIV